ncbi:MAG: PspA/IM30 family protein [Myxococcota bacterium]|nr:PspA/IM30 family protein [Myxococcota bacterium]
MGFFDRLSQVWKGFLGLWISDLENRNPEAVYEAAIEERIKTHRELKKAVSGIVYLRNKLQAELDTKSAQLVEISAQIPVAIEEGEEEAALVLLEKKNELESSIGSIQIELEKIRVQAEEAKTGLIQFQAGIEKLKREKTEMLAKRANAEARIKINDTLNGLSTAADIKALENVRENIEKMEAEADISSEIQGTSLDAKLAKIKAKTGNAAARAQLEQLKKEMAAKKVAASAVKKTI